MTAKLNPQNDIFNPIAALLQSTIGVSSYFGAAHLSGNQVPPRYVWVPTTGSVDGPSAIGDYPRSLADVAMTFEIHVWGASFDVSWNLLASLVSAVREIVTANYSIGGVDALPTEDNLRGWVLTVPITITLPLYEDDLDSIQYTKAQATIARIDDSQGVDPDGVLTAPLK